MTSVTIGPSVKTIADYAFSFCSSLTALYCQAKTPPTVADYTFDNSHYTEVTLYVPDGTITAYQTAEYWREFSKIEAVDFTGINDVIGDSDITVSVVNGEICIDGAGASIPMVEVYAANGACVYRGSDTRIGNLARGIYVVRIGSKTIKVVL